MDKESKLSSAVQLFDCKHQKQQRQDPIEPHKPSSLPMMLPNPHGSCLSSKRDQASLIPRENPSNTNRGPAGRGGSVPRSHGYSSSRHVRQTKHDPQDKMPRHYNDSPSQGRNMGKNSLDTPKRGFGGTRSARNSAGTLESAQTNLVPFEVKMADFPELPVTPGKKECWGPTPSAWSPQILKPVSIHETQLPMRGSPKQPNFRQSASNANSDSPVIPPGQPAVALPQSSTSGAAQTSWANVASQPPKTPVPKEKTVNAHMQKEKMSKQQEEGVSGKKKRKKKKKKAKGVGEDTDADLDEPEIYQEPPKFEDEEEFPGLTSALPVQFITSNNTEKLCNEENQRESTKHQSGDQNKEKSPTAKSVPAETAKKGQKAEKVSGKKSKVPVQLDIGNMLAILEKQQQSQKTKQDIKPVILSVGGALPVGHKQASVQKKPPWQQDKIAHNPLDSTSPLVKKGKQREVPKAKKPTPLKRVILKEREERKQRRLLEERGLLPENEFTPANDPAEEEQCDSSAADDVSSPTAELEDQPEFDDTKHMESEEGGEMDKDENGEKESTLPVPSPTNRPKIHSRKFRDYCSQMLSKDVDECVASLLKELVRFQDRLYQKDPMKARMKRRIVMGLREVLKHLRLRKVKCVVISPNCERIQSKGGLDEALHTIIDTCREQGIPFVFALSRKALGRCVNKAVPVSLVGIFNYDGAQDHYHKMIELSSEARRAYEVMASSAEQTESEDAANLQELQISSLSLAKEPEPSPDTTQPEEPEYIKIWKKMLEKKSNHQFLNFEEQLSSMQLASERTEQSDEEEKS
ncbi:hypothetical protein LDENG_00027040 [Lucifuga dentata]|nr:hypothetical protein LDENG_00027040 [Lucifuga dentata]